MIDLKLIPTQVYLAAIGALAIALVSSLGIQQVRISNVRANLATERQERATETSLRTTAALDHKVRIGALEARHAFDQQISENQHADKIRQMDVDRLAGIATAGRLRDQVATYAARDRRPGETNAAAVERYGDRLGVIGGLLAEGIELVVEGRTILGRRDTEVARLLDQIRLDRATCSAVVAP